MLIKRNLNYCIAWRHMVVFMKIHISDSNNIPEINNVSAHSNVQEQTVVTSPLLAANQHASPMIPLVTGRAAWTWINPIHLIWIWIWIGFGLDLDLILILSLDWIGFWIQNISWIWI